MSLGALLTIVLPVFGFVGLGYAIVGTRLLSGVVGEALASFTFAVAIPCLLFRALGTLAIPEIAPWPFWLTYFTVVAVNITVGIVLTEGLFGRDARAGVIGGMSASFSNTVMVGVPVLDQAFGEDGLVAGFLLVAVHLPVMMAVSAVLIELAEHRDGAAAGPVRLRQVALRTGRSLARSPLIIAIVAGIAFRLTGLPLTGVPRTLIDRLSDTAIPLALVSLGMGLHKYGIRGNVMPSVALGVAKLALMPAVAYVLAIHIVGLPPLAAAAVVVMAACPTGVNAYLIAGRFRTGIALAANTITLTTAASIVTFTLWLALIGS